MRLLRLILTPQPGQAQAPGTRGALIRRRRGGARVEWLRPATLLRWLPALALTHVVYPWALLTTLFTRRVTWRGIEYEVDGPLDVRMLAYRPYQVATEGKPETDSVM